MNTDRLLSFLLIFFLATMLSACGGGGSDTSDNTVARIEIIPKTAILKDLNDTKQLTVQAYNAAGEPLDAEVTWTSNKPDLIAVDTKGAVTNNDYVGSALITAAAGDVTSAPATILAIQAAANSVFVADQQVIGQPALVDPDTPVDVGTRYTITIDNSVTTGIGDILLGSETAPVGGKVVDVQPTVNGQQVTLELIPLSEMFSRIKIDENYTMTQDDAVISDTLAGDYTMEKQADGSYSFRPVTPSPTAVTGQQAIAAKSATGTFANRFHPFTCESTLPTVPLTLNGPALSDGLKIDLDLIIKYDSDSGGLQKLTLAGSVEAELKVNATVDVAFSGKIACGLDLVTLTVPVGGPLAMFLGAQVPIGVGFEAGGKLTLAQIGVEVQSKAKVTHEIGIVKKANINEWEMVNQGESKSNADYKLVLPDSNNLDNQLRLEPVTKGNIFAKLAVGNRFFKALRFDAFKVAAGSLEAANLSTVTAQVQDAGYKSDYRYSLYIEGGLASDAVKLFRFLEVNPAKVTLTKELVLATSPQLESAKADVSSFAIGDTVNFNVKLKTNTLEYSSIVASNSYNIDDIIIYRKVDDGSGNITTQEVARVSATSGQFDFDLSWTADYAGNIGSNFFVFVDTTALTLPFNYGLAGVPFFDELELGTVQGAATSGVQGVVYVKASPTTGSREVFATDPVRGSTAQLTPDFFNALHAVTTIAPIGRAVHNRHNAAWSRSTNKIAYIDKTDGTIWIASYDDSFPAYQLMDASGNPVRSGSCLAWSPDGSKLLSGIRIININSGSIVTLNSLVKPAKLFATCGGSWSPDGTKIAISGGVFNPLTRQTRGGTNIYIVGMDGTYNAITSYAKFSYAGMKAGSYFTVYDAYEPVWSPDGKHIAFQVRETVYKTYGSGSYGTQAQYDYNGEAIFSYDTVKKTLVSFMDYGTGSQYQNYGGRTYISIDRMVWSPDSSQIAFRAMTNPYIGDPSGAVIDTLNISSGGFTRLVLDSDFTIDLFAWLE